MKVSLSFPIIHENLETVPQQTLNEVRKILAVQP